MAFRDEGEALRARVAVLEQELAKARTGAEGERGVRERPVDGTPRSVLVLLGIAALLACGAWVSGFMVSGYVGERVAIGIALAMVIPIALAVVRFFAVAPRPDEAIVLSGRRWPAPDGTIRGYRVVTRGRTVVRTPIIEQAHRLDLRPAGFEIDLAAVFMKHSTPVSLRFRAIVGIASGEPLVERAVERFLDKPLDEVLTVARETLEGVIRSAAARASPDEYRASPDLAAQVVMDEADEDFGRLGLRMDTLHLLDVRTSD